MPRTSPKAVCRYQYPIGPGRPIAIERRVEGWKRFARRWTANGGAITPSAKHRWGALPLDCLLPAIDGVDRYFALADPSKTRQYADASSYLHKRKWRRVHSGPGHEGRFEEGVSEIDNPNYKGDDHVEPKRIKVAINKRHDPLEMMAARGVISDAQKQAGDRVRAIREKADGIGRGGRNLVDDRVDGGQVWTDVPSARLDAIRELDRIDKIAGEHGSRVLARVVIDGLTVTEVAGMLSRKAKPSVTDKKYISEMLQDTLDVLAVHFGFQTPNAARSRRLGAVSASVRNSNNRG